MTDIAIGAGPTIAVVVNQAIDSWKNRPAKPQPPAPPVESTPAAQTEG